MAQDSHTAEAPFAGDQIDARAENRVTPRDDARSPLKKASKRDADDQAAIEVFDEVGAGVAAKE